MARELLFRVTKKDFDETHIRGTGAGGQKKNKTSSGVRLVHRASGAVGESTDSREQTQNRAHAFARLRDTPEWKAWFRAACATAMGQPTITERIDAMMAPENIVTQVLDERSRWVDVPAS